MRVCGKATECDRFSSDFLEEERGEMKADWFAQEYLCEFTDSDDAVFARRLIEEAFDDSIPELPICRR
jgi:hypothetical protein